MQQKRSLIFQGFSRKVDNFYRFSVQLNAEFRDCHNDQNLCKRKACFILLLYPKSIRGFF